MTCEKCGRVVRKDKGDGLCWVCRTPGPKPKIYCRKCGAEVRKDFGDGLCAGCGGRRYKYVPVPFVACEKCGGRIRRDCGDGMCFKCRKEDEKSPPCRICGGATYKKPESGLCSRCEAKQKKNEQREAHACAICGRRILDNDGDYKRVLCWRCERDEATKLVQGVHASERKSYSETAREFHEQYGAAGERIREICRQDAEDRKRGKHISYGMRMAGKK